MANDGDTPDKVTEQMTQKPGSPPNQAPTEHGSTTDAGTRSAKSIGIAWTGALKADGQA